jgi:O-6-methylguanine DNA methyltransferase
MKIELPYAVRSTRWKPLAALAARTVRGLACLILTSRPQERLDELSDSFKPRPASRDPLLSRVHDLLDGYLAGSRPFRAPAPIDTWWADAIDRAVYRVLRRSIEGETLTYGEIARRIGSPSLSRRVGLALSRNWTVVAIPCHRVVRSDRSPGGFTGGVDLKVRLLEIERRLAASAPHLAAARPM